MKIFPLGENALTVEFGNVISVELNKKVFALSEYLNQNRFRGFIETVPAYSSLAVFYDAGLVKKNNYQNITAFEIVKNLVESVKIEFSPIENTSRQLEIPVDFSAAFALDLEYVCGLNNLTEAEFIEIFTLQTYRVFMLGFLPGFAYMGEIDEKIAAPRKDSPRSVVPRGSVGIAGRQTGIYPFASPGGWQIVGKTGVELFNSEKSEPSFFEPAIQSNFIPSNEHFYRQIRHFG